MKITTTRTTPTEVIIRILSDQKDLEPIRKHVLTHFTDKIKIPGFRPGKAPAHLIEKSVDQQAFLDEFMEHALNNFYGKALEVEKIRTAASPTIELKKFVPYTTLEFEAKVEVIGKIALPNYKTIKLAKPKVSATAKDVDELIETLLERNSQRVETKNAAKAGDEAIIDFLGKDSKGELVNGAEGKKYPLLLGSNQFIPGFEDNIIGMKPGDTKDFVVVFPKDYGVAALQSKKVTFSVTVHAVNELNKPRLDDKFASTIGPFKTVAELKSDAKKQLVSDRQWQVTRQYEDELVKKISAKSSVDIPKTLVDDQITRSEEEEKRNLVYRGQTWQEHLDSEGVTEEEHRERHRQEATDRVKAGLVLSEISEKEGIEVSDDEIELRLQLLRDQYQDPAMLAELDKPENRRDIAARVLTEKTVAKLVEYADK